MEINQGLSQLDKKVLGVLLITLFATVFAVSLGYFLFSQPNQTPNSLSPTPTPTSTPPTIPEQTPTPKPTLEPSLYNNIVFEWYLKVEYINNVTWLDSSWSSYDDAKTWSENYIDYIDSFWALPQEIADSGIGVLAKAAFVIQVSANVSFDEATGFTRVLYQYSESDDLYYVLESSLPSLADSGGWTKTYT